VINKIDLPGADVEATKQQIEHALALDPREALLISASRDWASRICSKAVVKRFPPPAGSPETPLRGLIFDSWFDSYRGVVILVRIVEGAIHGRDTRSVVVQSAGLHSRGTGVLTPKPMRVETLQAGEVGYVIANIKRMPTPRIGDTITDDGPPRECPLPGFEEIKHHDFCRSLLRLTTRLRGLRDALEKLRLNDSSFFYEPENSARLGFGFRCGSWGCSTWKSCRSVWNANSNLDLINHRTSVRYRITTKDGQVQEVDSPVKFPAVADILRLRNDHHRADSYRRPVSRSVLKLVEEKRGVQKGFEYVSQRRVLLTYQLPLNEIVLDFYDRLKSRFRVAMLRWIITFPDSRRQTW